MKKLFALLVLAGMLLFPMFGLAVGHAWDKSLTFSWEQPVDLENINGWSFYWSSTAGSGYVKVVDIPYVVGGGPIFETTTILHVTGVQGSTVTKYFVLAANGKGGQNSVYSNEVSYGFVIPYTIPAAPFNLIIKATTTP